MIDPKCNVAGLGWSSSVRRRWRMLGLALFPAASSLVVVGPTQAQAQAQTPAPTTDRDYDGVPVPGNLMLAATDRTKFAGLWAGKWGGRWKTLLAVEKIDDAGRVSAIYALGDNPSLKFKRKWFRYKGQVKGKKLTVFGQRSNIVYELSESGKLRAIFGSGAGFAVLSRQSDNIVSQSNPALSWPGGESVLVQTDLNENDSSVRLEVVLFRPKGPGPFPLALVNHGSTGSGRDQSRAAQTWTNQWLADFLNARGWLVAFPQRRGRGRSDGLYDEGFASDRSKGYTCEVDRSLAGADRALSDIAAAVAALRKRQDIKAGPMLVAGNSRGGALSVAYAGENPADVHGVINFVGGWMGTGCRTANKINRSVLNRGAPFARPMLWLYGKDDAYYSLAHNRANFQAFRSVGGNGHFVEVTVRGRNNGHWVMAIPPLWTSEVTRYLGALKRN